MVSQKLMSLFAGWGKQPTMQSPLPTLRNFGLGLVALLLVMGGLTQIRAEVWLDAAILVGGGLLIWQWRFGKVDLRRVPLIGERRLRFRRRWLGALLAVGAVGVALWTWRNLSVGFPTDADWLWYLLSIGLMLLAGATMERWQAGLWGKPRMNTEAWIVFGVVIVGTIVRLVALDSLPFGTWYDEAANGLESLRMVHEDAYRPIYTDGVNSTGHYLWLIVGAFKLFGVNTFAVRSISAAMGIVTIFAAYLAGRELHGHTLGLTWAVLVAVARWSITFSRLGMYNSATPLFELLVLFWLLRGLRRGLGVGLCIGGCGSWLRAVFLFGVSIVLGCSGNFCIGCSMARAWALANACCWAGD